MVNTLLRIDDLIESGSVHAVFIGRSAVKGNKRFATIKATDGRTVADGKGNSTNEALTDALNKIDRNHVAIETRPVMPGLNRNAMPGF